jgi:hypothetical protein
LICQVADRRKFVFWAFMVSSRENKILSFVLNLIFKNKNK